MKFGAIWRDRVAALPAALQQDVISYKALKKTVKTAPPVDAFLGRLQEACERVHRRFVRELNARPFLGRRRSRGGGGGAAACCSSAASVAAVAVTPTGGDDDGGVDPDRRELEQLYAFAELNRTCLYKICKRYDKRAGAGAGASPWCRDQFGRGEYAFLNPLWLRRLELELYGLSGIECPVCLEGFAASGPALILNCGHLLCLPCTEEVYAVRKIRGTFYNRLAVAHYQRRTAPARCPLCRLHNPLEGIRGMNVYPSDAARLLSEIGGGGGGGI